MDQADATLVPRAKDSAEVRLLKAEVKRLTEERDILKKPRRSSSRGKGEVRVHVCTSS